MSIKARIRNYLRRAVEVSQGPPQYMHTELNDRGYPAFDDAFNTILHRGRAEDCRICNARKGEK